MLTPIRKWLRDNSVGRTGQSRAPSATTPCPTTDYPRSCSLPTSSARALRLSSANPIAAVHMGRDFCK